MIEKLKDLGFFTYGKTIPGLMIYGKPAPYSVLNERAVRAGAGMILVLGLFSFFQAFYLNEYLFLKILVPILFFDFMMKVVIGTKFSPISFVANLIVSKQEPEYVGAIQKRFAWSIGLFLSGTMLVLLFVFGIQGAVNLSICGLCLTFMFMESAFGICIGCKMYNYFIAAGVLSQPELKPACPGNVCSIE